MTPTELALYQLTAFDLGDLVEIDESEIVGVIDGMRIVLGDEDQYLVAYHDNSGNPQRVWWPASALADAEDDDLDSNIIQFPTAHRGNHTRH